jgi:hypothetical protein
MSSAGSLDLSDDPGMLDPALHQTELGLVSPVVDEEIVNPLIVVANPLTTPPRFISSEGQLRRHFPVDGIDDRIADS